MYFKSSYPQVADVSVVIHMCGLFHQRYADFMGFFTVELMKMFENYNSKDEEKVLCHYALGMHTYIPVADI